LLRSTSNITSLSASSSGSSSTTLKNPTFDPQETENGFSDQGRPTMI